MTNSLMVLTNVVAACEDRQAVWTEALEKSEKEKKC
jgi:hypothetical protein